MFILVYRTGEQRTATNIMHSTWVPQRDLSICPPSPFSCACMPGYDRFLLPLPATVCVMGIGRRRSKGTHTRSLTCHGREEEEDKMFGHERRRSGRLDVERQGRSRRRRGWKEPRPHLTPRYSDRETKTHFMSRLAAGIWFAELNCLDCKKKWKTVLVRSLHMV